MQVAVIGSGISGLSCAWLLRHAGHHVTLFEKEPRLGGHTNTVSVPGHPSIDTGFIVFNEATYPNLIALFKALHVAFVKTDMSFGVSINKGHDVLEYAGHALFAQKQNRFNPAFLWMLADIVRFYKSAPQVIKNKKAHLTLGEYLNRHLYSRSFVNDHIVPMAAAIWSTDAGRILSFPVESFVRFFDHHGLFKFKNRPQWFTVEGGSRTYIEKMIASYKNDIRLNTEVVSVARMMDHVLVNGERFDACVLACHSDQALAILKDATPEERTVLSSFPYQDNRAYLHMDETLMPQNRDAWSSWNYLSGYGKSTQTVAVTYWMNKLQPFIGKTHNYFVTLNPPREPQSVLSVIDYMHPVFGHGARDGWKNLHTIQGHKRTWFAGAWCGFGFHEDGLCAGLAVAESLGGRKRPWSVTDISPAGYHVTGT